MKLTTKLWIGLGGLAILSPLGLIIPEKFKAGDAWGEWDAEKIKELTGYVPSGLKKLSSLWNAPLPDYSFKGWENLGMKHLSFSYIICAVIGIALCFGIAYLLGKFLAKKEFQNKSIK
jgi:PDGLE domain